MSINRYGFEQNEIRNLQILCGENNDEFIYQLATIIGIMGDKIKSLESDNES